MWLKKMILENFRGFVELTVTFEKRCTVLIGVNGSGKSSVLDAAAIALGSFLAGLDGISTNSLHPEDVRYAMYEQGSSVTRERQYPVSVKGKLITEDGSLIKWSRELNGDGGRTTNRNAKAMMDYAARLQKNIRDGKINTVLPLIAYYGTGRLWARKQTRRGQGMKRRSGVASRINGYKDCLDAASNVQMMLDWFEKMTYQQLQEECRIPELQAVEHAMAICYAGMDERADAVKVRYSVKYEELEISIKRKDGSVEDLPLHQLSDGIRTILTMVADIAYRTAVLNPQMLNDCVQQTPGVVLIDEIDMHLHPAWQKNIVSDLMRTFPNLQFILTTHAPSVLTNIDSQSIRILREDRADIPNVKSYGRNVNDIIYEVMGTEVRPTEVIKLIEGFNDDIDAGKLDEAKNKLQELREKLGNHDQDVLDAQMSYDLEIL